MMKKIKIGDIILKKEGDKMITIGEAIKKAAIKLKGSQIETPKLKSRLLMQYILNKPRQYLIVYDKEIITKKQEEKYFECVEKLIKGTPLQHITHSQEFMKMNFFVNENVLIPRADTECLVEEVIKIANKTNAKKILDLCTGSGIIAISLAKYIKGSKITAVDISEEALKVARKNAKINEVEEQVTFIKSDLYKELLDEKYDIIVSNPPYIKRKVLKTLDKEVKKEPKLALDGGYDGLDFYRKIIPNAYEHLKNLGYICLEIGFDQKNEVLEMLNDEGKFINAYCKKDLYDNDRVICAKLV